MNKVKYDGKFYDVIAEETERDDRWIGFYLTLQDIKTKEIKKVLRRDEEMIFLSSLEIEVDMIKDELKDAKKEVKRFEKEMLEYSLG